MRKHWLKIDGRWNQKTTIKAWNNLKEYLQKYPESKITVFNSETNLFHKFFCLECEQNYQELDIDCNSLFSGSLIHLDRKPSSLISTKTFEEMYKIYTKEWEVTTL